MSELLTIREAEDIADAILWRQEYFEHEGLKQSVLVVLMNYGDRYVKVACTGGEWSGVKGVLVGSGLPHCPNGHPLFETSQGKGLALIDRDDPALTTAGGEDG